MKCEEELSVASARGSNFLVGGVILRGILFLADKKAKIHLKSLVNNSQS